ncbi:hypothetical protein [Thalassobacillus pellis]|uniref:hypothetical protein n=1 Tax=Thalassobacillus pellis TaxID=748008 RepID=UPI001960EB26|nr:hypothetical protein [Thalassobacillus pellis]MBM7554917.1 hypothetical protein [Thalassobacillus pellis]
MKLLTGMIEMSVVAVFSVLFAGYALFIYPFEKVSQYMNPEVRKKQMKYAPQA